jgi:hypothetical protein
VEEASALVPSVLVDSTVRAAIGFAAGKTVADGLISTSVVGLAEVILKTVALTRLKLLASITLAVGLTATVVTVHGRREASATPAPGLATAALSVQAASPAGQAAFAQTETQADSKMDVLGSPAPPVLPGPMALEPSNSNQKQPKPTENSSALGVKSPSDAVPIALGQNSRGKLTRGAILFAKEWAPNDPMSHGGDGLGPVYNETSCVACHGLGGPGGAGPEGKNVVLLSVSPSASGKLP